MAKQREGSFWKAVSRVADAGAVALWIVGSSAVSGVATAFWSRIYGLAPPVILFIALGTFAALLLIAALLRAYFGRGAQKGLGDAAQLLSPKGMAIQFAIDKANRYEEQLRQSEQYVRTETEQRTALARQLEEVQQRFALEKEATQRTSQEMFDLLVKTATLQGRTDATSNLATETISALEAVLAGRPRHGGILQAVGLFGPPDNRPAHERVDEAQQIIADYRTKRIALLDLGNLRPILERAGLPSEVPEIAPVSPPLSIAPTSRSEKTDS